MEIFLSKGFPIMNLKEIFEKILNPNEFAACQNAGYSLNNPWYKLFDKDIPNSLRSILQQDQTTSQWISSGSIGAGKLADTKSFWILNPSITSKTNKGVYIAYLLAPAGDSIYLTLIQGTDIIESLEKLRIKQRVLKKQAKTIIEAFEAYQQEVAAEDIVLQAVNERDFKFGDICLGEQISFTSQAYEIAVILSKKYSVSESPFSRESWENDLKAMIAAYRRYTTLVHHHMCGL